MPVERVREIDMDADYRQCINQSICALVEFYYGGSKYRELGAGFGSWIGDDESKQIATEVSNIEQAILSQWSIAEESLQHPKMVLQMIKLAAVSPLLVSQYHTISRGTVKGVLRWFDDLPIDGYVEKVLNILNIPFTIPLSNKAALSLCREKWVNRHGLNSKKTSKEVLMRLFEPDFVEIGMKGGFGADAIFLNPMDVGSFFKSLGETDDDSFIFGGVIYRVLGSHTSYPEEHKRLLVMQEADKERKEFEKLERLYGSAASEEVKRNREPIAEDVRIAVWRRDNGCCVQCGSKERLEYDHIIPFSKGGSNTVRNIQLLCEKCNRTKSANI